MESNLGITMKRQRFEIELVYPARYAELTDKRLLHIIEKGMIGKEWGICVREIKEESK